jgi:hypothetical protein
MVRRHRLASGEAVSRGAFLARIVVTGRWFAKRPRVLPHQISAFRRNKTQTCQVLTAD